MKNNYSEKMCEIYIIILTISIFLLVIIYN